MWALSESLANSYDIAKTQDVSGACQANACRIFVCVVLFASYSLSFSRTSCGVYCFYLCLPAVVPLA